MQKKNAKIVRNFFFLWGKTIVICFFAKKKKSYGWILKLLHYPAHYNRSQIWRQTWTQLSEIIYKFPLGLIISAELNEDSVQEGNEKYDQTQNGKSKSLKKRINSFKKTRGFAEENRLYSPLRMCWKRSKKIVWFRKKNGPIFFWLVFTFV